MALLQPNITEEMRSTLGGRSRAYADLLAQARAAAEAGPDLIAIPESALPATWQGSERIRRDLSSIAALGPLVLFNDLDEDTDDRYYNAARLLTRDGLAGPPTARSTSFRSASTSRSRSSSSSCAEFRRPSGNSRPRRSRRSSARGRSPSGSASATRSSTPGSSRREVADGANLLATVTNDSWYGRAGAQEQHFAGAALRSVENDRYLIRAAITGISGIVDPRGRILAESRPDETATVTGRVFRVSRRRRPGRGGASGSRGLVDSRRHWACYSSASRDSRRSAPDACIRKPRTL